MPQLLPLTSLPQALEDAGYKSLEYESILEAAQAGWIPAEQGDNDKWLFDPAYLRFIAESLMLETVAA